MSTEKKTREKSTNLGQNKTITEVRSEVKNIIREVKSGNKQKKRNEGSIIKKVKHTNRN